MMNLPSHICSTILVLVAVAIQSETSGMILHSNRYRHEVLASTDRCPKIPEDPFCQIKVAARRGDVWEQCDESQPPSGANLPMHRWFRITGNCKLINHWVNISLPLAPQLVYR
jgi:hypothetical protein